MTLRRVLAEECHDLVYILKVHPGWLLCSKQRDTGARRGLISISQMRSEGGLNQAGAAEVLRSMAGS